MPGSHARRLIRRYRDGELDYDTFAARLVEAAEWTVRELRSNPTPSLSTLEEFWDIYGFQADAGVLTDQQVAELENALWSIWEPRAA